MCNGIFELKRQPYLLFQYPFCNKIKVLYIRVNHIVLHTYVLMLTTYHISQNGGIAPCSLVCEASNLPLWFLLQTIRN